MKFSYSIPASRPTSRRSRGGNCKSSAISGQIYAHEEKKAALSTVRTLKTEVVLIHCQLDKNQMLFYTNSSMKLTTGEVVANILSV